MQALEECCGDKEYTINDWNLIEVDKGIKFKKKFYALRLRGLRQLMYNTEAKNKYNIIVRGPILVYNFPTYEEVRL